MLRQQQLITNRLSALSTPCLKILACLLCSFTSLLFASDGTITAQESTTTVYKVVNPDGSVSYSDQPQHNSVTLEVAPISTIPAYQSPENISSSPQETELDYYQSLTILNPVNNSAFHSGTGNIKVSTKIEPILRNEDSIRFSLNGVEVANQKASTLQLTNIHRGTHIISVEVLGKNKQVLISSSNQFTVHRPIARSR